MCWVFALCCVWFYRSLLLLFNCLCCLYLCYVLVRFCGRDLDGLFGFDVIWGVRCGLGYKVVLLGCLFGFFGLLVVFDLVGILV